MAVQVLAGAVVAHGGARIGVAVGDLDGAEVEAGIEHGRDKGVAGHGRVRFGHLDPGDFGLQVGESQSR